MIGVFVPANQGLPPFTLAYCKEKGWDPQKLTMKQIIEISVAAKHEQTAKDEIS